MAAEGGVHVAPAGRAEIAAGLVGAEIGEDDRPAGHELARAMEQDALPVGFRLGCEGRPRGARGEDGVHLVGDERRQPAQPVHRGCGKAERERGIGENLLVEAGAAREAEDAGHAEALAAGQEALDEAEEDREIVVREVGVGERERAVRGERAELGQDRAVQGERGAAVGGAEIRDGEGRGSREVHRAEGLAHKRERLLDRDLRAGGVQAVIAGVAHADQRGRFGHRGLSLIHRRAIPPRRRAGASRRRRGRK